RRTPPTASSSGAEGPAPLKPARMAMHWHVLRFGKRVMIGLGGGVVVLAGLAMMVLPGPGVLTIALGLAILSLEFELPRIWLARLKARGVDLRHRFAEARARRRDHR